MQRKPISWTRGELVGQGAFGSVFVAMDNDTGELIAVKQVRSWRRGHREDALACHCRRPPFATANAWPAPCWRWVAPKMTAG